MKNLDEIYKILRLRIPQLQNNFRIKNLGIFGSYPRGSQGRASDIDILVEYQDIPDLLEFISLENYLSDLLGIKVDLVMKDALKERIKDKILKEVVEV